MNPLISLPQLAIARERVAAQLYQSLRTEAARDLEQRRAELEEWAAYIDDILIFDYFNDVNSEAESSEASTQIFDTADEQRSLAGEAWTSACSACWSRSFLP